jgi:hypothetical protein
VKGCASFRVRGGPHPPIRFHTEAHIPLVPTLPPGGYEAFSFFNSHRARTDAEPHKMAAYHHTVYAQLDAAFFLYLFHAER